MGPFFTIDVLWPELGRRTQKDGALHRILELADVAWPWLPRQHAERGGIDGELWPPHLPASAGDEGGGELGNLRDATTSIIRSRRSRKLTAASLEGGAAGRGPTGCTMRSTE